MTGVSIIEEIDKIRKEKKEEVLKEVVEIVIPERLKDFNFVLLGGYDGKIPIKKAWTKEIMRIDDERLQDHLKCGKNYGVQPNNSVIMVDGVSRFLIVVDFDNREFQDKVIKQFPETFTTTSGSPKNCYHLWFACNNDKSFKIHNEKMETKCDVIGAGNQVVGVGSKHIKSGSTYSIVKDIPFAYIDYAELEAILKPHDEKPKKQEKEKKVYTPKGISEDITKKIYEKVDMEECLKELGIDITKNPTNCFKHSSNGGKCLGFNDDTAHCFHCDGKWNKFSLIREGKRLNDKETFDWFAQKAGMVKELEESRVEYIKEKEKDEVDNLFVENVGVFQQHKLNLANEFIKKQPIYYERKGMLWVWDKINYCWVLKDETDILNLLGRNTAINTIDSTEKNEIMEALRQVGRLNKPKDIKPSWVQYKDNFYDVESGLIIPVTSNYFSANPINWKVGTSEDTPMIDKLFKSWVAPEDVDKLYEIVAFTTIPKMFIHAFHFLFGLPGGGKSSFQRLLIKFVGERNTTATTIERINNSSRFETIDWNKKLLITLSEVNHINQLKNSGLINQATGEDQLKAEKKGGDTFGFVNYGKFIYPSNTLLKVDVGNGFGRRVRVIKFINKFEKEKDVLDEIPDYEFENLAKKCVRIGGELWKKRQFKGDVNISQRMDDYQQESKTILERFISDCCDLTDFNVKVRFDEFYATFFKYSMEKTKGCGSKIEVSRELRKIGFETKRINWKMEQQTMSVDCWEAHTTLIGLKIRGNEDLCTIMHDIPFFQLKPHIAISQKKEYKGIMGITPKFITGDTSKVYNDTPQVYKKNDEKVFEGLKNEQKNPSIEFPPIFESCDGANLSNINQSVIKCSICGEEFSKKNIIIDPLNNNTYCASCYSGEID